MGKCCYLLLVLFLLFLCLCAQNGFQFTNGGADGFDVNLDFS